MKFKKKIFHEIHCFLISHSVLLAYRQPHANYQDWIGQCYKTNEMSVYPSVTSATCNHIWLYTSANLSVAIQRFILWRVSDEKSFSVCLKMLPYFVLWLSSLNFVNVMPSFAVTHQGPIFLSQFVTQNSLTIPWLIVKNTFPDPQEQLLCKQPYKELTEIICGSNNLFSLTFPWLG